VQGQTRRSFARHGRTLALAGVLACTLVAAPAGAQPSSPSLEVTRERTVLPNRYLLGIGVGTLAAAYIPSAIVGATSSRSGDEWLVAPVIGPWAAIGARVPCQTAHVSCNSEDLWRVLFITSGVVQVVGLTSIISSFIIPEHWPRRRVATPEPRLQVTPMQVAKDGYGVGVYGRW
jgi:hypothetical protein